MTILDSACSLGHGFSHAEKGRLQVALATEGCLSEDGLAAFAASGLTSAAEAAVIASLSGTTEVVP